VASERLAWAATVVDPEPGERVLEVGCGHGVLVDLMVARGAVVVGVDRSATMTAAAARRNRTAVADGRVRLLTGSLLEVAPQGPFDVVVSFDVRAFWTPPAPEWDVVRRVLAPDGRVVVACSLMGADTEDRVTDAVRRLGGSRGLALTAVHRGRTPPTDSLALELRRRHPNG
jgi:cyclopropane fatty-acyl-phospholipid synthase-like methyltransferase